MQDVPSGRQVCVHDPTITSYLKNKVRACSPEKMLTYRKPKRKKNVMTNARQTICHLLLTVTVVLPVTEPARFVAVTVYTPSSPSSMLVTSSDPLASARYLPDVWPGERDEPSGSDHEIDAGGVAAVNSALTRSRRPARIKTS